MSKHNIAFVFDCGATNFRVGADDLYRAILEALSERLTEGKRAIENTGGFKTEIIEPKIN